MVALAFGERYPDRVARLIVISAADRAHPMATAWRVVQRRIVQVRDRVRASRRRDSSSRARWPWPLIAAPRNSPRASAARRAGRTTAIRVAGRGIPVRARRGVRQDAIGPSPSSACPSPSTCIAWMRTRIFAPVTAIAVREDQLVPLADMRAHGRAPAERRAARDLFGVRPRCLPEGEPAARAHLCQRSERPAGTAR